MFTQIAVPVVRPEIVWEGLAPLIILGAGALLIVMFRSVLKQLPPAIAARAVPAVGAAAVIGMGCLLYTSPSPRDRQKSRMPSSA